MIRPAQQSDLEELIAEHGPSVLGVCRRTTGDTDTALEAFQDTFLVFTQRWDSLDQTSDLGPWLRETARRCALARARRTVRSQRAELPAEHWALALQAPSALEQLQRRDSVQILTEEFAQLDPVDQELLHLAFVEELAHREIAEQVGCPRGSMHARLRTARTRLEIRLKKRGLVGGILLLLLLFHENRSCLAASVASNAVAPSSRTITADKTSHFSSFVARILLRWPVSVGLVLLLGSVSTAAHYALRPARPLENWRVQSSRDVEPTDQQPMGSFQEDRLSMSRDAVLRSGTAQLQKCES